MSWYIYLNREQLYQRTYRSHNLWLNWYDKKIRLPKIVPFHIAVFKRIAKSYSGVSSPMQTTTSIRLQISHIVSNHSISLFRLVSPLCSGVSLYCLHSVDTVTSPKHPQINLSRLRSTTDSKVSSLRTNTATLLDL